MKKEVKESMELAKESAKEYFGDLWEFTMKHPRTAGTFVGMGIVYLSLVIPGLTVHLHDELRWVPKN